MTNPPLSRPRARGVFALLATTALAVGVIVDIGIAQQTVFRSAVDLVAVEVLVVDGKGNPIPSIMPEAFEVSIDGRRRRVVSAQFISHGSTPPVDAASLPDAPPASDRATTGRTLILAIDSGSFEPGDARAPMDALRNLVGRLNPDDSVGLYIYPTTVWIPPSRDRVRVRIALDKVQGDKQPIRSRYNLRPWEIVDITTLWTNPSSFLTGAATSVFDPVINVQRRECPSETDCPNRIYAEARSLALQVERELHDSLAGLDALLHGLSTMPGRKSVVLISAGLLSSDRMDGRPDAGNSARLLGQAAARANATVYTVHVDTNSSTRASAARRGAGNSDSGRERALLANWLDEFSDASGGRRIYSAVGDAAFAFDRVLRESSAYYLLGVEPGEEDRSGKPRKLQVKVDRRNVIVRSRQWVVIPTRRPS